MSSGTFPIKTQLPGWDRWNPALQNLPNTDSTCTGHICLATGNRCPLATPACSQLLTWVTLGLFIFPNGPSAFCLTMCLFGLWPYIAWKKWTTEKKQSKVIHTPRSWPWQWQDGLPENTDRPAQGLHWTILCLKKRPAPQDSSDWKGPQEISALTSCSLQAQHWGQTWLLKASSSGGSKTSKDCTTCTSVWLSSQGKTFSLYPGWTSPVSTSHFCFSPCLPAQVWKANLHRRLIHRHWGMLLGASKAVSSPRWTNPGSLSSCGPHLNSLIYQCLLSIVGVQNWMQYLDVAWWVLNRGS